MTSAEREPAQPRRADIPAEKAREMPQRPEMPGNRAYPVQRDMTPGRYPERPIPAPKPKEFFGVGAFVFCVAMIGVLAISTGVFAYLYFSQIGLI